MTKIKSINNYIKQSKMATFNTYDYEFLLKCISEGSIIFKSESLKRLTALAGSDKKQFHNYSRQILNEMEMMYRQDKQQISYSCIMLLNEIIINISSKEVESMIAKRHIATVIKSLGHPTKTNVRKAAHTSLISFLKTFRNFQVLCNNYIQNGFESQNQLIQQKSINSFQSILILQAKNFNWKAEYATKMFIKLIQQIQNGNLFISKAASQCILSICKMDSAKAILPLLSLDIIKDLKTFLDDIGSKLNIQNFAINPIQLGNILERSKIRRVQPEQRKIKEIESQSFSEDEKSEYPTKRLASQKKIPKNIPRPVQQKKEKEIIVGKLFSNFSNEGTLKERTDAVEDLLYKIQVSKAKPEFQSSIRAIFSNLMKTLKDTNPKIVSITLRILENIIQQIASSQSNLLTCIGIIVEKLGDQKISIRQNVSKVIKQLATKTNKTLWIRQLLDNLKRNTNAALKDETLFLIHHIYQNSEQNEIKYPVADILEQISHYTDDPKTKIKIRTLDCLSAIVFRSKQKQKLIVNLKGKLSSVFYQMFQEKTTKLEQQQQKKVNIQNQRKKKTISAEQTLESYRTIYNQRRSGNQSRKSDHERPLNVSMETVKKRVSLLRKPRNLLSTQETISVDNNSVTNRSSDRNIEDVEIILPSLYKKTTTNRFISRKSQFVPNKTIQNKASDYLSKDDLQPLRDPQRQIKNIMQELKSTDWKAQFQSINKLRRMIQFHPQILLNSSNANIHALVIDIVAQVENLRSSVSKNSLICLYQFINLMEKRIDPQIEILYEKLIKRSADTNVFISSQVQKCLNSLANNASPVKSLQKLSAYRQSKSVPVKDAIITTLLSMKDNPKIRDKESAKLAECIGLFLMDSQIDIRNKAKVGTIQLCKNLGDWYRTLRGKINPICFKSICELMTKSSYVKKQETNQTIEVRAQKNLDFLNKSPQKMQTIEAPIAKRRLSKVSQFPAEFNEVQGFLEQCNSSDWKKRIQSSNKICSLALTYPNQFMQYRSATHFIDLICKQINEPNIKVSLNAMSKFKLIFEPLRVIIQNNLGILSNSLFAAISSSKTEIKQEAQYCFQMMLNEIQVGSFLQYICQGALYSLPKSRVYLVNQLITKIEEIYQYKKQLLFKHIFPLLNKLMEEFKAQLMPHVINLFDKLYDVMGVQMFSHLAKFKEVRELIGR